MHRRAQPVEVRDGMRRARDPSPALVRVPALHGCQSGTHWLTDGVRRVPLLSGSRIVHVPVDGETVVLRPPPPPSRVVDAEGAVRDAMRFPLDDRPLAGRTGGVARATIVVEPSALPVPGAQIDPRPRALAAVVDELVELGVADERQTILVAGGLGRRVPRRDLERLLPPARAREFRGAVRVHDAADPELVPLDLGGAERVRVDPALVEADVVVAVSSAETIVDGGPGALLAACDAATVRRAAGAESLVRAAGEPAWELALRVESALAARVELQGVSLVLDHPRLTGRFRDYPHEPGSLEHVSRSPLRLLYSRLPASVRRSILRDQGRSIVATAAFAGSPAVAHAEALLRAVELRGIPVDEPFDALVVGVPWIGPHVPREPVNPITAAATTLGLALRLWRDAFPVRDGGTLVLVHSLTRSFAHRVHEPYRAMFDALSAAGRSALGDAESGAATDTRALDDYRAGRACHPLLPYADWAGCAPALSRLGSVVVAGSRDYAAARTLGFVPSHSVANALEMAHGLAGGRARVGVLLAPPYSPLLVGAA
jgi:lactate racemase-like protein